MLGNSIALLTLALMLASEGRRAEGPWRPGLYTLAAVVALVALALKPITNELPTVGTTLTAIFGNPLAWFVLLMGVFFVFRPFWSSKLPVAPTTKASVPVYSAHVMDVEEALKKEIAALKNHLFLTEERLKELDDSITKGQQRVGVLEGALMKETQEIRAQISLGEQYMRRQVASLYQALAAIGHREFLFYLASEITSLAAELCRPTTEGERYTPDQWERWVQTERTWEDIVRQWTDMAECYEPGITAKVLDTHTDQLMQKGVAKAEQFPDTEAFIAYKAFWIIWKQWQESRAAGEKAIYAAAFLGATTDSRPIILGDGIGEQNALAPRGPIRSAPEGHGEG